MGFDLGKTISGAWDSVTGAVGISHPDNPAAARGKPRSGTGPDRSNYDLGNDPNWLNNFANANQGIENQASDVANQGANVYNQSQGFYDQGGNLINGQAANFSKNAASAEGRYINPTQYDPRQSAAVNSNVAGGNGQYAAANQLLRNASAPQGPSAAQAQLRAGTDAALKSNLATARSGSGFGESAGALAAAGRNAGSTISQQGNNAAQLKAQEDQAYRAQQANDLSAASQGFTAGRSSDLGLAQQLAQQGQYDQTNNMNQRSLNDQYSLGLQNLGSQSQQMGLTAEGMGLQSQTAGINAQNQALAQQLAGQQLNLAGAQAQQQGGEQYENELSNIYAIDTGEHDATRQLNQSAGQAGTGGVLGLITGSDRRMKKNIRKVDLASRYSRLSNQLEALGG